MPWNTLEGRGPYIELASGNKWYVAQPGPEDARIEDIAAALSKLCRFGGHSSEFYSVAQHSVLCAIEAWRAEKTPEQILNVLMHDASEAYLVDVPRPVKLMLPEYKTLEFRTEEALALAFNLTYPHPRYVKEIDNRMLNTEQKYLMPEGHEPYLPDVEPYDLAPGAMLGWTPQKAESAFLFYYNTYRRV